ncbi:DUF2789 family protein [Marinomonas pollencensis]|uniref:Uncharacterized protein DUF2789 n=1 Tax=Marinomonas pollencensis TaxID=491954 RepID=A0A3E0DQH4_9GAMM|nr:DUF2789 family protein [Marinomonas pollencensis]REG84141.1 uncharacterized protein DUF2789 [Marinomonas pollencensis]
MDTSSHTIVGLFAQLGLGDKQADVEQFIEHHGGLPSTVKLTQASFFNDAQKTFLSQEWTHDSEWVAAIDELDALLR